MTIDRRAFLAMAGAAALPLPAARATETGGPMLIVNALGGLADPNPTAGDSDGRPISARILADARASGLNAVNETIGYVAGDGDPFEQTIRDVATWTARFRAQGDDLIHVTAAGDIFRARREGKIGVILGFQNAVMVGEDPTRIDIFANLGVRVIQLTYNPANTLGDGSMAPQNRGVTPLGARVIESLNANRVMVDLSHSGERTCLDAARLSRRPISINHTGCRALVDLPRNKTDAELRAVASRGGFVGIYFMPFLNPSSVATAADVVAHIDHAINVCGEDHVGIGTDGGTTGVDDMAAYRTRIRAEVAQRRTMGIGAAGENPDTLPFVEELSGPDQFRRLIGLLEARGYPARRIEKIMGLNFTSYARVVWGS